MSQETSASDMPAEIDNDTPQHALENIVEALLLASEAPLALDQLQRLLAEDWAPDRTVLRTVLQALEQRYRDSACELREVSGGWRLQVRADYSQWVARLWREKTPKLSRALLETLALIVYRQPVTRGEIEEVRGVAVSSNIMRTLLERGWVRELGHKEVPGRPMLYGSTGQLLDDLNLKSLNQLPELPAIKDMEQLEASLARLGIELPPAVEEPAIGQDGQDAADEAPLSEPSARQMED